MGVDNLNGPFGVNLVQNEYALVVSRVAPSRANRVVVLNQMGR